MPEHPPISTWPPEIRWTDDGSPTLVLEEPMHSLFGAFSETVEIYGRGLKKITEQDWPPHIFSMGLGLGYVEILTAALFKNRDDLILHTYESETRLTNNFISWLNDQNSPLNELYEKIAELTATKYSTTSVEIRKKLRRMHESSNWQIHGRLERPLLTGQKFSAILYDAFSNNSTPDVWQENFLDELLATLAHPRCLFTTYAATGACKRALKKNSFTLKKVEGFAGKRESTLALRA